MYQWDFRYSSGGRGYLCPYDYCYSYFNKIYWFMFSVQLKYHEGKWHIHICDLCLLGFFKRVNWCVWISQKVVHFLRTRHQYGMILGESNKHSLWSHGINFGLVYSMLVPGAAILIIFIIWTSEHSLLLRIHPGKKGAFLGRLALLFTTYFSRLHDILGF